MVILSRTRVAGRNGNGVSGCLVESRVTVSVTGPLADFGLMSTATDPRSGFLSEAAGSPEAAFFWMNPEPTIFVPAAVRHVGLAVIRWWFVGFRLASSRSTTCTASHLSGEFLQVNHNVEVPEGCPLAR